MYSVLIFKYVFHLMLFNNYAPLFMAKQISLDKYKFNLPFATNAITQTKKIFEYIMAIF